ncbi:hypothetical protein [Paraburkholderia phenoliruptrix]|uniref:hypothetical protein n=1 Tax=Paraburkholderia phenoliruptrix TaxID=252970 RepID=UPI0028572F90|nr:hypothetical protein [Paraburkholderia phenoliruptrix]MDR6389203.1 hypothetical protein [Paraburkholderia phenoliruptrix]MDR6421304.1 hypothetical protein [Paraburkholderia phenoliruptrix]
MVKRYGTSSMECENGIYVLHAEYEKVLAECERLRADAARFRWLNSQRENVWHEFASMPMNRTCEVIDQEIAKEQS